MNPKMFTMTSSCDGLELSVLLVKPEKEIKGVIQFVHGMAEHKERYLDVMQHFAALGYASAILDHRGHGKSVKSNDDLGYFYDESGSYIVEDAHQLSLALKKQFPNVPFILFGHSMGSLVVRAYTKLYDSDIDALIVCGSPSKNPMAKTALTLVHILQRVQGKHHRSALIQRMAFGSFAKRFKETYSENVWLSANEENVRIYDADDLCGFVFTLNGFENLFKLMIRVYDEQGWCMNHKDLPILFIAGENDPCIDNAEKFKAAYTFMQDRGYAHVEHHLFHGLRHEILNEANHEEVYSYIENWIKTNKF